MDADHSSAPPRKLQCVEFSSVASVASAVLALFTSEPALLETVVSFICVPKEEEAQEDENDCYTTKQETEFGEDPLFVTIVSLCRAFPTLAQHLGPQNQGFWRTMVLRRFDFTVDEDEAFNVEDCDGEWRARGPTEPKHPIRRAIRKYKATHPNYDADDPKMLEHDMAYWSSIGAHFRPAEYAFLREIQQGKAPISTWPDREDAYTLYRDLALLQDKLSKLEDLQTWSDGEMWVYPCLLSRMDEDVVDGGYELFKHCGFLPFYWDGTMHKRWTGFDVPLPPPVQGDVDEWDLRTKEEEAIFPKTPNNRNRFECLRRVVHESFSDWRCLYANANECPSAHFYIGKTKISGRWLGFVGESQY